MNRIVSLNLLFFIVFLIGFFIFIFKNDLKSSNSISENSVKIEEGIISVFKKSMKHWNLDYDSLPANRSGAACIPWKEVNIDFISQEIFMALGYGFNLYDESVAKKAAIEGCNRMQKYYNLQDYCNCEMVLYNDDSRLKVPFDEK